MTQPLLCIHDSLYNTKGEVDTSKYCCPIFITNQFGTALSRDSDLVATEDSPHVRSGTLTFVRHQDRIYGITCRHVVEELERQNRLNAAKRQASSPLPIPYHPAMQMHFYFPKDNRQVHIAAKFHKAPGDEYTRTYPDVAIARISGPLFEAVGRDALPISDDPTAEILGAQHTCGLATGYPEQKRSTTVTNTMVRNLAVSTVVATAPFDEITETKIRLFSELASEPDADNLSGMSGGPIIWSSEAGWGLVGIVKEGRDIKPKPVNGNTPIVQSHAIWIDGERLTKQFLTELIESIPENEEPIHDFSKTLIGPGLPRIN